MPGSTYLETHVLDQYFGGGELAQVSTALTAGQTAVTSIATATAGHTVAEALSANDLIIVSFGTANAEIFTAAATSAAATSITVTSQTSAKAHAIGDVIVRLSSRFPAPAVLYVGLSTAAATGTDAAVLAAEPTATGGYARVAVTNNLVQWPAATGTQPATKSNANAITFPQSTAAWSTGATNLVTYFVADSATLGAGNLLTKVTLTTAQTVNAASITPSFAASALTTTVN